MKQFGLIGFPLSHSFSAQYFAQKFQDLGVTDTRYELYPIPSLNGLRSLVESKQLSGFNVTIPYKESILPLIDHLAPRAQATGAVNCVKVSNGRWEGYNTDTFGFQASLEPLIQGRKVKRAMVLGTGGSSRAVQYVLQQLHIDYGTVSRSGKNTYERLMPAEIAACDLIINTTPLGMHPKTDAYPDIPYEAISARHLVYDLIYNPEETRFLQRCKLLGATTQSGIDMLHLQADKSWELWNS